MLIFGYDEFVNGKPTTNGFDNKNESPINLGWAGYQNDINTKDGDMGNNTKPRCYAHHYDHLCHCFDIDVKQIDEIEDKYYYVIDVFDHNFWNHSDAMYPNISDQVISDIKKGKAKILVLFIMESIRATTDISKLFNTWAANYNLPHNSIVFSSGNFSFGDQIRQDKCITYIPHSAWEHLLRGQYSNNLKMKFYKSITSKIDREKVFLNYNRRAKYHRCKIVYELQRRGLFNFGFVSLGRNVSDGMRDIPVDFYQQLPITFDDTDLDINHASELIEKDFLNSYISLVTESHIDEGEVFPTEKIFKPIIALHPFIVIASPYFLETIKSFGYKTFSDWFDESYDSEPDLNKRIDMILKQIKILSDMSKERLNNMLIEMLPILQHNFGVFASRLKQNIFIEQLEKELWK